MYVCTYVYSLPLIVFTNQVPLHTRHSCTYLCVHPHPHTHIHKGPRTHARTQAHTHTHTMYVYRYGCTCIHTHVSTALKGAYITGITDEGTHCSSEIPVTAEHVSCGVDGSNLSEVNHCYLTSRVPDHHETSTTKGKKG